MDSAAFLSQFPFNPEMRGAIGIEREYFLLDAAGRPLPRSPDFLAAVSDPAWTYELSACQVEHRTKPAMSAGDISGELRSGERQGRAAAESIGARLAAKEVGPTDMPLDIYPHDARYRIIAAKLPPEILLAASRVTGLHIHIGAESMAEAISFHNACVRRLDEFIAWGDHSGGKRIRLYKAMAQKWRPPIYGSAAHFHQVAIEEGFEDFPRNCWHLIRITRHGTVELRMFGMTEVSAEVLGWVSLIRETVGFR